MSEGSGILLNLTTATYPVEKVKKRKVERDNEDDDDGSHVKTPEKKKPKKSHQKGM